MRHRGRVGRALRLTALLAGGMALVLVTTTMVSIPAAGPLPGAAERAHRITRVASAGPLDRPGRLDPYLVIEGLPALLSAGSVVVAPDYLGLGVTGPSSYLIGTSEAGSLLGAVRVARQLPTDASTETLLWGNSQGGHAVLFAAQEAASSAPELALRAAAVAAPARRSNDLSPLPQGHPRDHRHRGDARRARVPVRRAGECAAREHLLRVC